MDECCCETPEANGSLMRLLVFACVRLLVFACVCCVLQGSCPMDEWIEAARRRLVERSMGGAVDGAGAPCPACALLVLALLLFVPVLALVSAFAVVLACVRV